MASKKAIVIGAGFAGIAAATCLAKSGFEVTVLEKNNTPGGRARRFEADGFTFDMGPSWYWMPDVFDQYFERFGHKVEDFYELQRLDPAYKIVFEDNYQLDIPANYKELQNVLESIEIGAGGKLIKFLDQAKYKYEVGIKKLVYKPGRSIFEYFSFRLLLDLFRLDIFQSTHTHVRKFFKDSRIIRLMEFPVLFLGATPQNTPALYSLMNYADLKLGTWYPKGGMYKIVEGLVELAKSQGVKFQFNSEVLKINLHNHLITHLDTSKGTYPADVVVAGSDYHHVEKDLISREYRTYSEKYWNDRVMAPSSLIFYLGLSKKVHNVNHHNLFFDQDFGLHAQEIYDDPKWPSRPLFYVSVPSITDPSVAPEGCENLFILIPVAPGIEDTSEIREKYFDIVLDRFEKLTKNQIRDSIIFHRSYAHNDFISDYHAFKGNAYGLANTLSQTAILKPRIKSKKIKNLYFTGQLTVPGPGVPPSLISGQVVAGEISKDYPSI